MRKFWWIGINLALLIVAAQISAFAQDSAKRDYIVYCSSCHGVDGRGAGPAVQVIPGFVPTDLTRLTQHNQGKFPEDEVRATIDGRKRVPGHSDWDTDMPLWGLQFQEEGKQFSPESEAKVKRKIDALVSYVRSLQRD